MREASWCFDDESTGPFINNGCTFETGSPIRGAASAKVDCSQVQTFTWFLNPSRHVLYWAARFNFSDPGVGCGLVRWTDYNGQTVDLRLGDAGKIFLAVDDIPRIQNRRLIEAGVEFHLQGEIFFTSFIIVRTRLNHRALYDLNYGPVAQAAGIITQMDFGSFLGTGSGTCLIDDAVINNSDQDSRRDFAYPGNFTGRIDRPNAAGTFQEWAGDVSDINDADDATMISTSTNGAKASYSFPAVVLPTGRTVLKASLYLIRARSPGTPRLRIGIRNEGNVIAQNEKIRIFFSGLPDPTGIFQIEFNNNITSDIEANASSLAIENILGAHPDIGAGNVIAYDDDTNGPGTGWIIEFVGRLAGEAMPPFHVGGSGFGGVTIGLAILQKGNKNFFHPPVGELWDFIPPYVQPVLETEFSNHQYHSLLKPDTHSIWSKTTLGEFDSLLEYFSSSFAESSGQDDQSSVTETSSVPNDDGINEFGINAGTGVAGESISIVEPEPPPPVPPAPPDPPPSNYIPPAPGAVDFRLMPGSPALNAGTTIATVTTDIRARARDASPSAGAYEGEY